MTSDAKSMFPVDPNTFGDLAERLLNGNISPISPPPTGIITLDALAAENGAAKSQNQWIEHWNAIKDGRYFASAADYYQAGKTGNPALLASLQHDFRESRVVTSTRIEYSPTHLGGRIIHRYGSIVSPVATTITLIPVYGGNSVEEVVQDITGVNYLKTLFNTTDTGEQIMQTLEDLSGKQRSVIKVYTLDQNTRKSIPQRAVGFTHGSGSFLVHSIPVDGGLIHDFVGRSRGVRG